MSKIVAAVIQLAQTTVTPPVLDASVRHWWLAFVKAVQPERITDFLPDEHQLPAYTLSHILRDTDGLCYLRITTLTEALSHLLLSDLLPALPATLRIGEREYPVVGVATDASTHADAGTTSYAALIANGRRQPSRETYRFRFLSPLAFRRQGLDLPLPDPIQFYGSLVRRWEYFSGEPLLVPLTEFIEHSIVISHMNARTAALTGAYGAKGCLGSVAYHVLPRRRQDADRGMVQHQQHLIAILSDFAIYAGVGIKVTHGMGQVRLLERNLDG